MPFDLYERPPECGPSLGYCIHDILGLGGSAVVFQAKVLGKEHRGRQVALKCLTGEREVWLHGPGGPQPIVKLADFAS